MPIILSGGGDPEAVVPVDRYFAEAVGAGPVLYIPIAMEPHVYPYDQCFDWFRATYAPYGITDARLCTDLSGLRLDSSYGGVMIGGGNTFKLLDAVRRAGFGDRLREYLRGGGTVYGSSAGAILMGASIGTAVMGRCADENHVGLTDLSGLDLLDGWDVWCHYTAEDEAAAAAYGRRLYALSESSGLVWDGAAATALGTPYRRVGA